MIQKLADELNTSPQVVIATFIILIIAFIIVYIKITMDEKKGADSQEKADIRKLIDNVVPNGTEYVAAYAHGKEVYRRLFCMHHTSFGVEVVHYIINF